MFFNLAAIFLTAYRDIRNFDRIRGNENCDLRKDSGCKVFQAIKKPDPIPDDIYVATKFGHEYNWVITSSESTGTGAFN